MRLRTERLVLRPWTYDDVNDLFAYAHDERVGPNAGWLAHRNIYDSYLTMQALIDERQLALEHQVTNKVIGSIGCQHRLHAEQWAHLKQREVGFVLHPDFWGAGFIVEAATAYIDYLFRHDQLDLLWCSHYDFNTQSERVITKLGFTYYRTDRYYQPLLKRDVVTKRYVKWHHPPVDE